MKNLAFVAFLFLSNQFLAQTADAERVIDFTVTESGAGHKFTPVMPPLIQKPGAPKAHWTYFWEFGDGSFSREASPTHTYARPGDFIASLDATAHYDDGKKAKRRKKNVRANATPRLAGNLPLEDVFDPKATQMLAMNAYSKPRAEEEIVLTISYRNLGALATDGRLHLFYNEKKYPTRHFDFAEARTHFGETVDNGTSMILPMDNSYQDAWTALLIPSSGGLSTTWNEEPLPSTIIKEMLNNARGVYREESAWRFSELQPGEKRNLFVSLACTPNMLRDTNAMIHLEGVFAPFDPVVAPERFVYEIEIVGSHDPNAIAVSDNRVNYRTIGSKKLDYKIQFQNNGEGPASKVEVSVDVPKGLKMTAMRPVEWYPKCPICPKAPDSRGCLDTATVDGGLVFTFRNIYLPGSRQEDVDNRDSTKGFVKYRITAKKEMPKRPFKSRAKIVFDKNPPIYTNYTKTGFKVGISPGIKVGYGFDPDSIQNGYYFLGASLSPFKSWRVYPQVELLSGIKVRTSTPEIALPTETIGLGNTSGANIDTFSIVRASRISERGFVSFEIPVLLRKNFSKYVGLGLGFSTRVILENGKDVDDRIVQTFEQLGMEPPTPLSTIEETVTTPHKATRFRYSLFADLTLGAVRAGPNVGIRGGVLLNGPGSPKPFAQLSLELKL